MIFKFALSVFVTLSLAGVVEAQQKGIETRGGSIKPSSSGQSRGSTAGSNAQVLGLGAASILNGLSSTSRQDEIERDRSSAEADRWLRKHEENKRQGEIDARLLIQKHANAKGTNPFGKQPTPEPKPVDASAVQKKSEDNRAPYASKTCVQFKRIGSGITSENVGVFNKCSFPVQVLHCFHSPGNTSKCSVKGGVGWGVTRTIDPGDRTISISSTNTWDVAYFVCNMTGIKNSSKFCLRPK